MTTSHNASSCKVPDKQPPRQNRLTGGIGLYMNYSIIFTEISFHPETSILLQIIQIIHMTFPINPEFDRPRAVCLFCSPKGTTRLG